jgi:Ca2+-binding RTX toxin-like protein
MLRQAAKETSMCFELLEKRVLRAVDLTDDGVVVIDGASNDDVAMVVVDTRGTGSTTDDKLRVDLSHGGVGVTFVYDLSDVTLIEFRGNGGNDQFFNTAAGISSDAWGGDGNDTLSGAGCDDRFWGQNGDDRLSGNGGHDSLYGGAGLDTLSGGSGDDRLDGGYDGVRDRLTGGSGADTFITHGDETWFLFSYYRSHQTENWIDFDGAQGDAEQRIYH